MRRASIGRLGGGRVARDRGRVEAGGRHHRQDRAGRGVDRDDRAPVCAELRGSEVLEPTVDGERPGRAALAAGRGSRRRGRGAGSDRSAHQDVLVGPLDPGRPEAEAGVPDDVGERLVRVRPTAQAVDHLEEARSRPVASKIVPRGRVRRAAMTSGLSARAASCGPRAPATTRRSPETTPKASRGRRRGGGRWSRSLGGLVGSDRRSVADREEQPGHDEAGEDARGRRS